MKPLLIYIPLNADLLKEALDGVVTLMSTETYKYAIDIMLGVSGLYMAMSYVKGSKVGALTSYFLTTFLCLYALIGIKVSVAVQELQNTRSATESYNVDNVPLGIALPAALISQMGRGITLLFSDALHMPNDMEYNKSGMIFGSRVWLSSTTAGLSMSPELSQDLSSYIRQCVFSAKLLASHKLSAQTLKSSPKLSAVLFKEPSLVYRVIFQNGDNLSCVDAAKQLQSKLPHAAKKELAELSKIMSKGNNTDYNSSLSAAHDYFMGISATSSQILTQNILINEVRNAQADAFAFEGADAQMMNYTNSNAMQKMHIAEANSFALASFNLPNYMSIFWIITVCIFPLVFLIALIPSSNNVFKIYMQSQAYLWSWPPMFIIIHFCVSFMASRSINIFGVKSGGITFSNIDAISSKHSFAAYVAGALATSVPVISYYITKGLSPVLSGAAHHLGGLAQSMSSNEAQAIAQGNISMASYSGWNMNYDNVNANKHDTNAVDSHGRSTIQLDNGTMRTENANGSITNNVQPAMSNSAVDIHGSERAADSLQQSANQYFSASNQHRTAADEHNQAGISGVQNFTENDTNNVRTGAGISSTSDDSYSQDIKKMKDSVDSYNVHHNKTEGLSSDQFVNAKVNSGRQLGGMFVQAATGASVEFGAGIRHSTSGDTSNQEFNNSSEGKAYHEAYSHLIKTAENNHLDASDSHDLSKSEQIAFNLSKGHSLMQQSSAEYSKGEQLSNTASHVQEHSSSINSNLNQAFHDYALKAHPSDGEKVMSGTDMNSINTQNQWANEFMSSDVGKNALSGEVSKLMSNSQGSIQNNYDSNAKNIKSGFGNEQDNYNNQYKASLANKTNASSFSQMSPEQLKEGNHLRENNHHVDITFDKEGLANASKGAITKGHNDIAKNYNKNKDKF